MSTNVSTQISEAIRNSTEEAVRAAQVLIEPASQQFIEDAANLIANCYQTGNKVIVAGNGGSLCDAAHFAEELTGRFRQERRALPAIALSEPGHITCVGNDMGFDRIFARGVEAFGQEGDVFVALTTSGNSANLVRAVETAQDRGLDTICFLGKTGGELKGKGTLEWIVSGFTYSDRVQEAHMAAIHIIIEMVERVLFERTN